MWDASSSKKNELQRTTKALISLRGRAGWSAPLLFAHILRWVFSATLAIDHAQVALLLYGQLFNGVLLYTHWNIGSTFMRGWIRYWIVVKVTFSKTVRGNEEWPIKSVIKNRRLCFLSLLIYGNVVCEPSLAPNTGFSGIRFSNNQEWTQLSQNKNIICIMVMYGETFYGRHTAIYTHCSKVKKKSKRLLWKKRTHKKTKTNYFTVTGDNNRLLQTV